LITCPNCGREVQEDFSFCPYCETSLKPFCPSCKRELERGYARCPYCGFKLGGETEAKKLYVKGGRSRYLNLIIVLMFVGGIISIVQGADESTYQYANYLYPGVPEPAHYLALPLVVAGVAVAVLGLLQFLVAYGLIYGKAFPRIYMLKIVSLTFGLALVMFALDGMISFVYELSGLVLPSDVFFVLWALFVLVVVWRYVSMQEMKAILRSTGAS
jgi:RNA polymerase subunit RPABC4/transcription elongation factor Spt4